MAVSHRLATGTRVPARVAEVVVVSLRRKMIDSVNPVRDNAPLDQVMERFQRGGSTRALIPSRVKPGP